MNQQFYKNMALWVVILVVMLLLVTMLRQDQETPPDLAYSDFITAVRDGQIEEVTIEEGGHVDGRMVDASDFTTYVPAVTEDFLNLLEEKSVKTTAQPKDEGSFWRQLLVMWFPLVLFIGLWIFFIR